VKQEAPSALGPGGNAHAAAVFPIMKSPQDCALTALAQAATNAGVTPVPVAPNPTAPSH
jgi:hypothetical protein